MNSVALFAVSLLLCALPGCRAAGTVREEPVRFQSGSVTLAGSLFLPAGGGRHAAVVLFHGSGPQARDTSTAHWFAEQGIAALAYDKRGIGESSGDFNSVPFPDLHADGLAAIAILKARGDIDPRKIGVWGLSQGGWLGPLAASRSQDVAFVIAVSGPGVTPGEQMVYFYANQLRERGLSESDVAAASSLRRFIWQYLSTGRGYAEAKSALARSRSLRWYSALQAQQDGLFAKSDSAILDDPKLRSRLWFKWELNYDPTDALRKLTVPSLFLFGDRDQLVPVETSVNIIRKTLTESHASDFTIKTFPGADHGMYVTGADGVNGLAPGYLETMKQWVLQKTR